jgi:hypothetical protein
VATLLAAGGVVEVLRWVHVLAWGIAPRRERRNPRLVLGLVAGVVLTAAANAAAELNATLWERRAQRLRPNTPPP